MAVSLLLARAGSTACLINELPAVLMFVPICAKSDRFGNNERSVEAGLVLGHDACEPVLINRWSLEVLLVSAWTLSA